MKKFTLLIFCFLLACILSGCRQITPPEAPASKAPIKLEDIVIKDNGKVLDLEKEQILTQDLPEPIPEHITPLSDFFKLEQEIVTDNLTLEFPLASVKDIDPNDIDLYAYTEIWAYVLDESGQDYEEETFAWVSTYKDINFSPGKEIISLYGLEPTYYFIGAKEFRPGDTDLESSN